MKRQHNKNVISLKKKNFAFQENWIRINYFQQGGIFTFFDFEEKKIGI